MAQTKTKSLKKSSASRSKKSPSSKTSTARNSAAKSEVEIDRRRNQRRGDSVESATTVSQPAEQLERRQKVNRRRQIDPTTCERDYTDQEVEFMNALDAYKRRSGRMFPTCSEVLEVLRELGYLKVSAAELALLPNSTGTAASAKPMTTAPGDFPDGEMIATAAATDFNA